MTDENTPDSRVESSALLGEQTSFEIVQGAIDTANAYASGPHVHLRIVTLRMDDALRVLDALDEIDRLSASLKWAMEQRESLIARVNDLTGIKPKLPPNTKLSGGEAVRCSDLLGGDQNGGME